MEKDHLEILLEDIQGKFELVLEGHESLRKDIREARDESNQKHEHTAFLINTLNKKIDAVATDLAGHRADTEGHKKTYRVGDREDWEAFA
jgi:hypothetical protein